MPSVGGVHGCKFFCLGRNLTEVKLTFRNKICKLLNYIVVLIGDMECVNTKLQLTAQLTDKAFK